jgi:hypothetical protein
MPETMDLLKTWLIIFVKNEETHVIVVSLFPPDGYLEQYKDFGSESQ